LREGGVRIGVGPGGFESPAFEGTDRLLTGALFDAGPIGASTIDQAERRVGARRHEVGGPASGALNEGMQLLSDFNPSG
jgi:hypothetical protein